MVRPRSRCVALLRGPSCPSTSRRMRPTVEPLEGRIGLDVGLAALAVLSATTADSRSVTYRYEVTLPGSAPSVTAEVAFFRSADPVFELSGDVRIDTQVVPLAA